MAGNGPNTSTHPAAERKSGGVATAARVEQSPAQTPEAEYFDTPAHDLAARRVTLRRRLTGPGAGWQLTLPAGPDGRGEVRAPLGPGSIPNQLRDVVLAIVRDRPLAPVARVGTTTRSAPDDAGPADPLHRAVAEHVDELLAWDRAVRVDADDAVHQMRVATRKIRSLLQASGLAGDAWILDELRHLAAVLGVARDAEVLAERYRVALDGLAPELVRGRVRQRLVDGAVSRYQSGRRRSLTVMRSPRYFRLLDDLEAVVATEPAQAPVSAASTVEAAYRRVRKAAKTATREDTDEALHRIRKRAKQLRYTAVATGATKVAKRAKTIQTMLGDHQDSVVSRAHLVEQADAAAAAGEDTFSYGLLYEQEDDLARRCRARLDDALKKLDKAVREKGERVGL